MDLQGVVNTALAVLLCVNQFLIMGDCSWLDALSKFTSRTAEFLSIVIELQCNVTLLVIHICVSESSTHLKEQIVLIDCSDMQRSCQARSH